MKRFNTTAICIPSKHYMVDISERVSIIKGYVDSGKYFSINKARQFGKTTTLNALKNALKDEYTVLSYDFQGIDKDVFSTGGTFSRALSRKTMDFAEFEGLYIPDEIISELRSINESKSVKMDDLFRAFKRWIKMSDKPVVMMIDEVDSASNNQVFLDFLAQLRYGYIARESGDVPAFHSVILAGVTDVKHLKNKIRDDEQHKVNSPWNIAADFNVDMRLPYSGIQEMLEEYARDHGIVFDTALISQEIVDYTNGYPFLVSRICQLIDEEVADNFESLDKAWSPSGFQEAIKIILAENNSLFQSLTGKLSNYPKLRESIRSILMNGTKLTYNADQESISQMEMYGFIVNDHNSVRIANRIFETRLYNLFISDEEISGNEFFRRGDYEKNQFVSKGKLDMRLILQKFAESYTMIFGNGEGNKFLEKDGRELFLLFIKPIINGTGNYYIEAQTRDQKRTDVIIDYLGQQYIVELKIWHGERYNKDGEKQICEYLDYWHLDTGYMLSFNFNKSKQTGVNEVRIGKKVLYEAVV